MIITFLLLSLPSRSANYETLPKGVRLAAFSKTSISEVGDYLSESGQLNGYGAEIKINSETLSGFDVANEVFLDGLKEINKEAYENFTAGEWSLKGSGNVQVYGLGMGYGLTNRLTLFGITTFWKAKVNMSATQTKKNNYSETQDAIDNGKSRNGLMLDPESFPVVTGGLIQNIVTNVYGYKPLGDWESESIGDIELGAKYLIDKGNWGGVALSLGTVIPTGRVDDPDILQDFSFGNGFWTAYAEVESTYQAYKNLGLELSLRYSFQLKTEFEQRVPTIDGSLISSEKANFNYYPGSRLDFKAGLPFYFNDWLSINPQYLLEYDQEDVYQSDNFVADYYLGQNTMRLGHSFRVDLVTDTVNSYFKKKFPIPFIAKIIYQKVLDGKNVPSVSRTQLELRTFF